MRLSELSRSASLPWVARSKVSLVSVAGSFTSRESQLVTRKSERNEPRCGVAMNTTRETNGCGSKKSERFRIARDSGARSNSSIGRRATLLQKRVAALDDHQLGQQAALRVTDHDHLPQRGILAVRIELRDDALQRLREDAGRPSDRDCPSCT